MEAAAEKKRSVLHRLKQAQPWCIYCGGEAYGNSVDHMPPIGVFSERRRPQGLEFLACKECNHSARSDEAIVSLMSRVYPDATTDAQINELRRIMAGVSSRRPALIRELMPTFRQSKEVRKLSGEAVGALNARGPLLNRAMLRFGAKLAFALHFEATQRLVPIGGGAAVFWFPNHMEVTGKVPSELMGLVGDPKTLVQGRFSVPDQFTYGSVASLTASNLVISAHTATFRQAFRIHMFVADDITKLSAAPNKNVFKTGFLRLA